MSFFLDKTTQNKAPIQIRVTPKIQKLNTKATKPEKKRKQKLQNSLNYD